MKHYTTLTRLIGGVMLIYTSGLLVLNGNQSVITHWNRSGTADSWGNSWQLLILPVLFVFVSEIMLAVAKHARTKAGLTAITTILVTEWRALAALLVIAIIFGGLMLAQLGRGF